MRAKSLPGRLSSSRLDNGLETHLLRCGDSPVVTVVLTYRVGSRHEPPGRSGLAHFLEHMMFKGSGRYGAGEIDRRTRQLGGSNNAFTTRDATTYYFSFAADRWTEALAIEADRMVSLELEATQVERERSVILEELAMYEAEPWDALERRVLSDLFGDHPYGRPIIGRAEDVEAISTADLDRFHRTHYRPDRAVLVVAGAIDSTTDESILRHFGGIEGAVGANSEGAAAQTPRELVRCEVSRGRVARFVLALPAPRVDHQDFAALRLICALLASGRSSLLTERLVECEGRCGWVAASVGEAQLGGVLEISAELVPGGERAEVERIVFEELARLREQDPDERAVGRARRILQADWVFAHERVEALALMLSQAAVLVGVSHPVEQLAAIDRLEGCDLRQVAERYLDPKAGAVLGWAVPEGA